jgi:DNA-binding transcriptional MerR regulator
MISLHALLRYYEEIGLITSVRSSEYAYHMYDEDTIQRLQKIIILRKLRIPLKEIKTILLNENAALAILSFQKKIVDLDTEIMAPHNCPYDIGRST